MRFVFLGAPGAGKGTQAAKAAQKFNIPHISTGEIFRDNIRNNTELGKQAKLYIDKGQLCPDSLTVDLVKDRIINDDCKNGFIFDGFPRTINQANELKKMLEEVGIKLDAAINLDIKDEVIIDRMSGRRVCPKCGGTFHIQFNKPSVDGICDKCETSLIQRDDDNAETVKKRLVIYHEQSEPLIEYYENEGILVNVDASKTLDEIFDAVSSEIEKFMVK